MMTIIRYEQNNFADVNGQELFRSEPSFDSYMNDTNVLRSFPSLLGEQVYT